MNRERKNELQREWYRRNKERIRDRRRELGRQYWRVRAWPLKVSGLSTDPRRFGQPLLVHRHNLDPSLNQKEKHKLRCRFYYKRNVEKGLRTNGQMRQKTPSGLMTKQELAWRQFRATLGLTRATRLEETV